MQKIEISHTPFKGHITHDRICNHHVEALEFVVEMYSPTQKLALLDLTHEDLISAVDEYYDHYAEQLKALLSKKLVDEAYGGPFYLAQ